MPLLTVRLIYEPTGKKETVLASVESDRYDPEHLDALVNACLTQALAVLNQTSLAALRSGRPEISVLLSNNDKNNPIRPSLHLSMETLTRLTEAGAEFDFDPYV